MISVLTEYVPYPHIAQFSKTDIAYATAHTPLRPFVEQWPILEAFAEAMERRKKSPINRGLLQELLRRQYSFLSTNDAVSANIEALGLDNTFTVTTAHQPCLFTGPLYVPFKILSVVKLAAQLTVAYPDCQFVPVFYIGGEDHDFDEINHTSLYGKKLVWDNQETGSVGPMQTASLAPILAQLRELLGNTPEADTLYSRVEQAYHHTEFQTATQALLHEFFGRFGVVVINTNDASLKREFLPYMRREITEQLSEPLVQATQKKLQNLGFKTQAFARPINLFYMRPQSRERIERTDDDHYTVVNTDIRWTEAQILAELDAHPERFSPNVVMRPVYQEAILPNIAYIGGGGEIAYWIERKTQFEAFGLPLPLLVRRDSAMWLDAKQRERLEKLQLPVAALFQRPDLVINTFIARQAGDALNLDNEAEQLKQIFESLAEKARQIDPTLEKTMLAEGAKATQNLEQLGSRLTKAAKQKQETAVKQLDGLLQKLCPGGGLQERSDNFLPYVLRYGDQWLDTLLAHFDPLRTEFLVLMEE